MAKHVFSKDELIEEVEQETEVGKKIVEVEMAFLKELHKLMDYILEEDEELFRRLGEHG